MWYIKPATNWNEALPVGNGRLGAMVFGNPINESIQLNELTFWSGGPSRNDNPDALASLPEIRQLIFDGNYSNAESLINQKVVAKQLHGSMYQTIGNLSLSFQNHAGYSDYHRELDLERAVNTTSYIVNGVTYKQEIFASKPDEVIVVKLSASEPGKLTFKASLSGPLSKSLSVLDGTTLEMTGLSAAHEGVTGQVKFDARVKLVCTGGTTSNTTNSITVSNADEVMLLISIATNFTDYKSLADNEIAKSEAYLSSAFSKPFSDLLNNHITAYQKYFNRVSINLGSTDMSAYPTDLRIKNFSITNDKELIEMYYQFGRYLLISSSQPGGQPANLQGLWNDNTNPSWDSKYTININTEMNYWPAEKCNLPEMHQPLIKMIQELSESGQKTAKDMYGCDGWVAHHNTDIWRISGVVDGAYWGMWPMGGAWLSQHLWEKYLYNGDLTYLDSVYPSLKSACEFYQDFLIEEPATKWLVVSPSISPENNPSVHGQSIAAGNTMDNQLLFDLFAKTIKAASLLNKDSALMVEFKAILNKLPPMQIGNWGQLQEWMQDWDNPQDHHRHVSHLYGMFPSNQISPYRNPELFSAVKTSMMARGDESTGWSMGWKINLWARLMDGDHARKLISDQLTLVDPTITSGENGGTYPNFFDAHPPFQIDGNFGCTSGITEMLLQSHDGAIHFLPALPNDWKTGNIKGLRAYGGFDVDFEWDNGQIQKIVIKSNLGGNCRIRVPNAIALINDTVLKPATGTNENSFFAIDEIKDPVIVDPSKINPVNIKNTLVFEMPTNAGETYTIVNVTKPEITLASVVNSNKQQISLSFNHPIKKQSYYTGFTVAIDKMSAPIDSVVMGDTTNQLLICLKGIVTKENAILLSYNNGNVLSKDGESLDAFTDMIVDNLLTGANPRILELKSDEDGKTVFASFNMKIKIPSSFSGMSVEIQDGNNNDILVDQAAFVNTDSTILALTLGQQVFAENDLLFSYTGNSVVSADSGLLNSITDMPIINIARGEPLEITSVEIDTVNLSFKLVFNKLVAYSIDQTRFFTISVNDIKMPITKLIIDTSITDTAIILQPKTIRYGDVVTLSYTPGQMMSTNNGMLQAFNNMPITNPFKNPVWYSIPGLVEAENYSTQFGIKTDITGDTVGGLNVTAINTNDWMEYALENTSDDSLFIIGFRVASNVTASSITMYLDDNKLTKVVFPNTKNLQTFTTTETNIKILPGKHYLRLYATKGGFNFNFFEIASISTDIFTIKDKDINVYPNPVKDELYIETPSFYYNKIEITDTKGNVVLIKPLTYMPKQKVNVNLPNGVYIVTISNGKQSLIRKIAVNK